MLKVIAQTGEIFVYDVIGANWYGDGITALNVAEALKQIGDKRAVIRINSPGGIADEGIAIYNILKRHSAGVDTYNDALAASAASMVFLAGENRYAAKGSRVMIHRASAIVWGNATTLTKEASTLDKYDQSQAEIYATYLGKTQDETIALLEAETWYTSEEAVTSGLASMLTDTAKVKPNVATWFRNPPKSLADDIRKDLPLRHDAAQIALDKKNRAFAQLRNARHSPQAASGVVRLSDTASTVYVVGDRVQVKTGKNHDDMTKDAKGAIVEISTSALGIKFDGMPSTHKWYTDEEVKSISAK